MSGIFLLGFIILFLFAACKVSSDADKHADYMEEYGLELNVFTLKEFLGEPGDVLDPYGKTLVEYEECYIELARLIKKAVYKLYNDIDKEYEKEE